LQAALTGSAFGDEIWAAAGTYKPTAGTDRTATFQLIEGVAVYGGFAGVETARDQRNPATNVTILSGDIGAAGNSDNSYHVVTGVTGATLDGFTITAGTADAHGGGMYNYSSSPTLTNVTFSGNSSANEGGGMYNYSSSPTLTNVTFSGNTADNGGGMENYNKSSPQIRNTIFWGNTASIGAQIYNYAVDSTPGLSDSIVQGGCPAGSTCTNIIATDPLLDTLGNYGGFTQTIPLLPNSSAINTVNDAVCPATDQHGERCCLSGH